MAALRAIMHQPSTTAWTPSLQEQPWTDPSPQTWRLESIKTTSWLIFFFVNRSGTALFSPITRLKRLRMTFKPDMVSPRSPWQTSTGSVGFLVIWLHWPELVGTAWLCLYGHNSVKFALFEVPFQYVGGFWLWKRMIL